jgi:ribosomal protein S12 methylthiotransferase accessory factor
LAEPLVLAEEVAAGVTVRGVAFVTREHEIELELPAGGARTRTARWLRALRVLARGGGAAALATAAEEEALLAQLRAAGVLVPADAGGACGDAVAALGAAIVVAPRPRVVATAEEGLVLPRDVPSDGATAILRAFVAGIASPLRLELYALTALTGEPTVLGDRPAPAARRALDGMLDALDPGRAHVVRFADERVESFAADEVLAPSPAAGRLRIVSAVADEPSLAGGELASAAYACPDLRFASERAPRRAFGSAPTRALARTIAATEAVERFACGDVPAERLRVAAARELPGAVPGDRLVRFSERQYARAGAPARFDPERPIAWAPARSAGGAARWVPASLVFTPYAEPQPGRRIGDATTSGVAADARAEVAARRALLELVERDAFMWTWLQRLSRPSIATGSLPGPLRRAVAQVAGAGRTVRFVDLTLDTKPVVLCAVLGPTGHGLGTAAGDAPTAAAARAFAEAVAGWTADPEPGRLPAAEAVRLPLDHRRWYGSPERREHAGFLWGGADEIGLDEVEWDERPVAEAVAGVGEPLLVALGAAGRGPLRVVRALVPGLVPLTFGHDAEPLGMPRLRDPIATRSGRSVGRRLDAGALAALPPHPLA